MNHQKVVICVGVPGSGKSTKVASYVREAGEMGIRVTVCSADDGHLDAEGQYKFRPELAAKAHSDCLNKFIKSTSADMADVVVVDNTNISNWERQNYVSISTAMGCELVYWYWPCDTVEQIKACAANNVHGVPIGVIADMALRMERPVGNVDVIGGDVNIEIKFSSELFESTMKDVESLLREQFNRVRAARTR